MHTTCTPHAPVTKMMKTNMSAEVAGCQACSAGLGILELCWGFIYRTHILPALYNAITFIYWTYTHTHPVTPKPVNFGKVDGGDGSWRRLVLPRQCCVGVTSLVPTHVIGSAYPVHKRNELSPSKWFSLALPLFSLSSPFVFHPRLSNKKTGNWKQDPKKAKYGIFLSTDTWIVAACISIPSKLPINLNVHKFYSPGLPQKSPI